MRQPKYMLINRHQIHYNDKGPMYITYDVGDSNVLYRPPLVWQCFILHHSATYKSILKVKTSLIILTKMLTKHSLLF